MQPLYGPTKTREENKADHSMQMKNSVAYVRKIQTVQAVIPGNVRIKNGVRTENVHWKRELDIVIRVMKTARKVY